MSRHSIVVELHYGSEVTIPLNTPEREQLKEDLEAAGWDGFIPKELYVRLQSLVAEHTGTQGSKPTDVSLPFYLNKRSKEHTCPTH